jgi:cytochrome c biogenesis protein CcmG/thiol:disulfide interchange protein DsbE
MRRGVVSSIGLAVLLSGAMTMAQTATDGGDPLGLIGRLAPHLDGRVHIGPRVPSGDDLKGQVVLVFFWAHWCPECKAESEAVATVLDKYRSRGLAIIAPTQRYGYVAGGRPAPPDKELRYIIQVRDSYYKFLDHEPVPVGEVNAKEYGANLVPLQVVIDRQGVVRFYHAGRMTEQELEEVIRPLL